MHLANMQEMRALGYATGKAECPQCHHKEFKYYLDDKTGQVLNSLAGYCDRQAKCCYHARPNDVGGVEFIHKPMNFERTPKKMLTFPKDWVRIKRAGIDNTNLVKWLRSLPWNDDEAARLEVALLAYGVGADENNNTIFWQMDSNAKIRSGKIMDYLEDGHRNKKNKWSISWVHSKLIKKGIINGDKYEYVGCLFGEHLIARFPNAKVCVVESEKTCIIMSALFSMEKYVWVATGSKGALSKELLHVPLRLDRQIVLFPDYDGHAAWTEKFGKGYYNPNIFISRFVVDNWTFGKDPANADCADIAIRKLKEGWHPYTEPMPETQKELYKRLCKINPHFKEFAEKCQLEIRHPNRTAM